MRVCDAKISTLYFFLLHFLIVLIFNFSLYVDCWHDELNGIKSSKKEHASRWLSLAESPGRITTASATKKAYFLTETSAAMTLRAWCPAFTPQDRDHPSCQPARRFRHQKRDRPVNEHRKNKKGAINKIRHMCHTQKVSSLRSTVSKALN